jgi:hypothetical protein
VIPQPSLPNQPACRPEPKGGPKSIYKSMSEVQLNELAMAKRKGKPGRGQKS